MRALRYTWFQFVSLFAEFASVDSLFVYSTKGWDPVTGSSIYHITTRCKLTLCTGVGTPNFKKLLPLFLELP